MTTRLLATDSLPDMITKASEGLPGAVVCLCDVAAHLLYEPDAFIDFLLLLDEIELRGRSLHIAYADYCGVKLRRDGDSASAPLLRFVERVRRRDQVMLGFAMPTTLERGHG